MNSTELECLINHQTQHILYEGIEGTNDRTNHPQSGIIKKLVLALSEFFIAVGIFLHNCYQPSIEATLSDYHAHRKSTKTGPGYLK